MQDSHAALDSEGILANARALVSKVAAAGDAIEAARRIPDPLLASMTRAGLFRIAMPRAWGGPEMSPLDQVSLIETLACADASAAWVACILSDSGFYAGWLEDATARALFDDLDARCAGMLAPVGRAEIVEGGYRVDGHWSFGSGVLHATHVTGGCLLTRNGNPIVGEDGMPCWRVMIFSPADVEVLDTWYTTGLNGTGSNDYRVAAAFVPEAHSFDIRVPSRRSEALFRYHGFFFANVPGVPLGIARAAIRAARELAEHKVSYPAMKALREQESVKIAFGEAEATLGAARAYVFDVLGNIWDTLCRGDELTLDQRARVGLMMVHTGRSAQRVVDLMCEVAGSSALYRKQRLERLRRDMLAVNSHLVHQTRTYRAAGEVLLGLPAVAGFF